MDTISLLKANEYIDIYIYTYIFINDVFHFTVLLDCCVTEEVVISVMEMCDYRDLFTSLYQHSTSACHKCL